VGRFSTNPKAIASQVAAWCGPDAAELAAMARKAKALGRPNATFRIVKDLAALTKA
jgi:1,2-diacylglycerol 3-beta-galactosyltransferase